MTVRSVVVDASAFVVALTRPDDVTAGGELLEDDDADLHVPAVCDLEVPAALLKAIRAGYVDDATASGVLRDYLSVPLTRYGHQFLVGRVFDLRDTFSPFDAAYVALAEGLDAQLVTADRRLARAVASHTRVPVIAA